MIPWLETPLIGFLVVTVFLAFGASWMMGQALAATWRPVWQVFVYGVLLGLADRFMNYALFEGKLSSLSGLLIHTILIILVALIAYRMTQARVMVQQYPWLYARAGLFGWREIGEGR